MTGSPSPRAQPDEPEARTAARAFILDPSGRVLLIQQLRDLHSSERLWVTPGGGIEGTESLAECVVREVFEETGLRIQTPQRAVHTYRATFPFDGHLYDQTDHFFLDLPALADAIRDYLDERNA